MKANPNFILREIAENTVLIPIRGESNKFDGMVMLKNETAVFLWNFFAEEHTEEDAVSALLDEYDVDKDTASKSVRNFISSLKESGALLG